MIKRTVGWEDVRRCSVVVKTKDYRSGGCKFKYRKPERASEVQPSVCFLTMLYCESEWLSV